MKCGMEPHIQSMLKKYKAVELKKIEVSNDEVLYFYEIKSTEFLIHVLDGSTKVYRVSPFTSPRDTARWMGFR